MYCMFLISFLASDWWKSYMTGVVLRWRRSSRSEQKEEPGLSPGLDCLAELKVSLC
jgi:hypothetical protein